MDTQSDVAKKWAVIVDWAERSGLSYRAFAEREGLSSSSLARWRRRLRGTTDSMFLEVAMVKPLEPLDPVVVEVGGAIIHVTERTDLEF